MFSDRMSTLGRVMVIYYYDRVVACSETGKRQDVQLGLCDVTLAQVKGELKGRRQLSWAENVENMQMFSCA